MGMRTAVLFAIDAKVKSLTFTDWRGRTLKVYWQFVDVPDNPTVPYIRASVQKIRPDKTTVEAGNCGTEYMWLLQLSVVVKDNLGQVKPDGIIEQIEDAFQFASVFGNDDVQLKVSDAPRAADGVPTGSWVEHPVQIRLRLNGGALG